VKAIDRFPQEQTFDWGLWALIGGVALLVLLVAAALMIVLIRRRRRGAGRAGAPAPAASAPPFVVAGPPPVAALSERPSPLTEPGPEPVHLGAEHDVVCPNCGEANPHGARFCANCGQGFASTEKRMQGV
jgi:hypothetical protein